MNDIKIIKSVSNEIIENNYKDSVLLIEAWRMKNEKINLLPLVTTLAGPIGATLMVAKLFFEKKDNSFDFEEIKNNFNQTCEIILDPYELKEKKDKVFDVFTRIIELDISKLDISKLEVLQYEEIKLIAIKIFGNLLTDTEVNFKKHKETYDLICEKIKGNSDLLYKQREIDFFQELGKKNKQLEHEVKEKERAYQAIHDKEKEMLSFFTHTMRNALATAPESLRQAIRLLNSDDYTSDKKHYKAINKIVSLFSTLSLTDCLIDTFKQSISEPEEFQRAWKNDIAGDATLKWVIAAALRQSLNRIIFMSDTSELRQLLHDADTSTIIATRKSFIDDVLPLNVDNQGIEAFYQWLIAIDTLDIQIEESIDLHFGANQVKFSLLFSITSELLLNALKYWDGTGKITVRWYHEQDNFILKVSNPCQEYASSNLAGTHKGLAFIKRLIELLGEQASFTPIAEKSCFTVEFKLHQSLLEG